MRGLANAAVEGLLVCDGETIVTVNESFAGSSGCPLTRSIGAKLEHFLPDEGHATEPVGRPHQPVEGNPASSPTVLVRPLNSSSHPIDYAGGRTTPSRSAISSAQAGRAASSAFSPITLSHRPPQSQHLQHQSGSGIEARRQRGVGSPCCASTSIASSMSTICSVMPPATRCSTPSRSGFPACSMTTR